MTSGIGERPGSAQSARVVHRVLFGGLLLISAAFLGIAFGFHDAPLMPASATASMMGYAMAASGIIPIILGMAIVMRRVPTRSSGQDDDAFWRGALGPVLAVWAILEGGGVIGAVGALLTGSPAPALVVVVAFGCLAVFGPNHFESA